MWVSAGKSISILRLRDNKKKVFQGFWSVNEEKPKDIVTPIGLEFEIKVGKIYGMVQDCEENSYFVTMNFKEKKKLIVPTSSICIYGTVSLT